METPTNHRVNSEALMALGYTPGRAFGVALRTVKKHAHLGNERLLAQLADVLAKPDAFASHAVYGKLAKALIEETRKPEDTHIPLRDAGADYAIYGESHIEAGARTQMDVAMQLPVTVAGALMPDAHQGYGLPIDGVLATNNAVIPYGVGVDIGCRMARRASSFAERAKPR